MARMADASPPADDRIDPRRGRRLAAICPGLGYFAVFPADHHLWITIGILQLILVRLLPSVAWLGPLQVSCDVVMITGVVYTTGLQDSNFTVLYLLVIIVASILFSRQGTFITSLFCISS